MNLGLLGCDDVPERFRQFGGTYREMFEALLRPHVPGLRLRWYDVHQGELPQSVDACDAWLCTGSRYSVYENRDWITALKTFVRDLNRARSTYVGICFGHQMLAEALGGKVERADVGWGVGVHGMTVVQPEAWMQPAQPHCRLQYMHADQVVRMPPESTLLAAAEHCPVAMFRVGETMLGIEGHPEFPAPYVEALVRDRRERIGPERADTALESVNEPTQHDLVARWIGNFLGSKGASK